MTDKTDALVALATDAFLSATGQAHKVTELQRELTTKCMRAALPVIAEALAAQAPAAGDGDGLDYAPGRLDREAPPRIWLQIDTTGNNDERDEPWPRSEGVTWQDEEIGGLEIQYVRADLASRPAADSEAVGWSDGDGGVLWKPEQDVPPTGTAIYTRPPAAATVAARGLTSGEEPKEIARLLRRYAHEHRKSPRMAQMMEDAAYMLAAAPTAPAVDEAGPITIRIKTTIGGDSSRSVTYYEVPATPVGKWFAIHPDMVFDPEGKATQLDGDFVVSHLVSGMNVARTPYLETAIAAASALAALPVDWENLKTPLHAKKIPADLRAQIDVIRAAASVGGDIYPNDDQDPALAQQAARTEGE